MSRWTLSIRDKTDRSVRQYLARTGGKKGDLSRFVDEAVTAEIFRRTLKDVRERNADLSEDEAMKLADEAIDWVRANSA